MFRTVPPSIIRSVFTVHSTAAAAQFHPGPARKLLVYKPVMTYTIVECTVNKLLMMDGGTVRNM
jgi:hypothetical protein